MDDEKLLKDLDLAEFETTFKLNQPMGFKNKKESIGNFQLFFCTLNFIIKIQLFVCFMFIFSYLFILKVSYLFTYFKCSAICLQY